MSEADEDPLDVDMSASYGKPEAIAGILDASARSMQQMPDGTRYDFELSITERETTEKEEKNE